jgi:hypothetical protein
MLFCCRITRLQAYAGAAKSSSAQQKGLTSSIIIDTIFYGKIRRTPGTNAEESQAKSYQVKQVLRAMERLSETDVIEE